MPEIIKRGAKRGQVMVVPGIYAALLAREQEYIEQVPVDPRWKYSPRGLAGEPAPPERRTSRRRLEELEAGEPVRRSGGALRDFLPDTRRQGAPRRREDGLAMFEIRPDDTVRRSVDPCGLQ